MKELVEFLVKSLAEHPDQVSLTEDSGDDYVLMELKVATDDLGKIIGKRGNTVNAIRVVLQAAASSRKKRARLEVMDANGLPSAPNVED
jgi:uncharacterized protein